MYLGNTKAPLQSDTMSEALCSPWVVVGASRGIGLEFVKQLLEAGQYVIAAVRNPDGAKQLQGLIKSHGKQSNCVIEKCDVASSASIDVSSTAYILLKSKVEISLYLQNFAARIGILVKNGTHLNNVILNAGILKYPNRVTELYEPYWVCLI